MVKASNGSKNNMRARRFLILTLREIFLDCRGGEGDSNWLSLAQPSSKQGGGILPPEQAIA